MALLTVNSLIVRDKRNGLEPVKGISFSLQAGQSLGLVGESGSGKSLTCQAIMGVLDPWLEAAGEILFDGRDLLRLSDRQMRELRGSRIGMIIQDVQSAFDPLYKIGPQMIETLKAHTGWNTERARERAESALDRLQMPDPRSAMRKYPHQLSGGMLQRVMEAITLALNPEVVIADEPTTALDSITRKEVVGQFVKIKEERSASMIFVSHDFGVIRRVADQVVVLRRGEIVEQGPVNDVFAHPAKGYTKRLAAAHAALSRRFRAMAGREGAA